MTSLFPCNVFNKLQVDVENLKKELQEKQDLLCQALRAMELEEEEHKKETQEKEEALHKYQQQIYELEQRLQVKTNTFLCRLCYFDQNFRIMIFFKWMITLQGLIFKIEYKF